MSKECYNCGRGIEEGAEHVCPPKFMVCFCGDDENFYDMENDELFFEDNAQMAAEIFVDQQEAWWGQRAILDGLSSIKVHVRPFGSPVFETYKVRGDGEHYHAKPAR